MPFYGSNRPGARSRRASDAFWLQGDDGGLKGAYDCIKAFSETDLTEDLKQFDVPTLILHGDDDQIVPIAVGRPQVGQARHERDPEGLPRRAARPPGSHEDEFNADLLAFVES